MHAKCSSRRSAPLSPQVHGPRLLRYSRDDQRDNTIYTTLPPPSQHNPFTVAVSMALDYADGFGCGCDGEPAFFELRAPPWAPPQSNVTNTTAALHLTEGAVVGAPGSPRCIARPSNRTDVSTPPTNSILGNGTNASLATEMAVNVNVAGVAAANTTNITFPMSVNVNVAGAANTTNITFPPAVPPLLPPGWAPNGALMTS
jgi:hypothetical protein